jgi:hypothetical protein
MVVVVDYNVGFSINFPLKLLFDAVKMLEERRFKVWNLEAETSS